MNLTRWVPRLAALAAAVLLGAPLRAPAQEYFEKYDLTPRAEVVDLAVQPNAYPLAFISAVMQRDRLLRAELQARGLSLRALPFKKGNDIYRLLGQGRIEMAFMGDMPTVNAIVTTPTVVVGLGKRNYSSVVARDYSRLEELRGKKVGYSAGSSSHLVLLRGLDAASMTGQDIELVALEPAEMPDALESGRVAAFSAWEPTPSISLQRNPRNKAIFRGMSTDLVVFAREFVQAQPAAAESLVAAYARAIHWMRRKAAHLEQAADWVLADATAFNGQPPRLTKAAAIGIARKDLLDVPGAPTMPTLIDGAPPLTREYAFLKAQGRIPAGVADGVVAEAFRYDGLKRVQSDPRRFRLFEFSYDP